MSPAVETTQDAALRTQPTPPIDPRPAGIRLMLYRAEIADWSAARAMQCDAAWFELDQAPVRLDARQEPEEEEVEEKKEKDEKEGSEEKEEKEESPPPPPPTTPPGKVALVKARLAARGPSCLRREVLPLEDTPACLLVGGPPPTAGGRKAGLYAARRGPATATPRAPTTPPRAPSTNQSPARVGEDAAPSLPMDIDEEPVRIARPMGRALSMHLFGKPPSLLSDNVPAAAEPMDLTNAAPEGGPMPLKRKRGGAEDADAAPPAKRLAEADPKQARWMSGSQSAESGVLVGRRVQPINNTPPSPSSHALSGTQGRTKKRRVWRKRAAAAWTATIRALATVTARLSPKVEASMTS